MSFCRVLILVILCVLLTRCGGFCPFSGCTDSGGDGGGENPGPSGGNAFKTGAGFNGTVTTILPLPSGKVYVAGGFTSFDGASAPGIARLNSNGTLDTGFNPGTGVNGIVNAITTAFSESHIYLAGSFTTYNGTGAGRLVRVTSTGAFDGAFAGLGFNNAVNAIFVMPNLLAFGAFTSYGVGNTPRVAMINTGTGNTVAYGASFSGGDVAAASINSGDDYAYVGGSFTTVNGTNRNRVVRLDLAGGVINVSFSHTLGCDGNVNAVLIVTEGSEAFFGGNCANYEGGGANGLFRVQSSGLQDPFSTGSKVGALAMTTIGAGFFIGGTFTDFDSDPRGDFLVRMSTGGAIDATFNQPGQFNDPVRTLAPSVDGTDRLYVGGDFTSFGGTGFGRIIRLQTDGSVD